MILALQTTGLQERPALAMGRGKQLPAETSGLPDTSSDWNPCPHVLSSPWKYAQPQKTAAIFK